MANLHRKIEFNREFTEILVRMKLVNQRFKLSYILYFWLSNEKEKEPRLEPRMGNQYGGKLTLILDDQSEIVVES